MRPGGVVVLTGSGVEEGDLPGRGTVLYADSERTVERLKIGDPGQISPVQLGSDLLVSDSRNVYTISAEAVTQETHSMGSEGWAGGYANPAGDAVVLYNTGMAPGAGQYITDVLVVGHGGSSMKQAEIPYFVTQSGVCDESIWVIGESADHLSSAVVEISWDTTFKVAQEEDLDGRELGETSIVCINDVPTWLELDTQGRRVLASWNDSAQSVDRQLLVNDDLPAGDWPVLGWAGVADNHMVYLGTDGGIRRVDPASATVETVDQVELDEDSLVLPTMSEAGVAFLVIRQSAGTTDLIRLDESGEIGQVTPIEGLNEVLDGSGEVPRSILVL
ncbi:hypothetical protein [Ornithinimicrobium avium]|nr:hypothetical protein [Ornithinimicrobium avium]